MCVCVCACVRACVRVCVCVGQEASSLFSDVVTLVHAGSLPLVDEDGDDDGATVELLRLVQLMWSRCLSQPRLLQLSAHSRLPTHIATSLWVRRSLPASDLFCPQLNRITGNNIPSRAL